MYQEKAYPTGEFDNFTCTKSVYETENNRKINQAYIPANPYGYIPLSTSTKENMFHI